MSRLASLFRMSGDVLSQTASASLDAQVGSTRVVRLHVVHGPATGQQWLLDPSRPVTLGRVTAEGVTGLDDKEVSRTHLRLEFDAALGCFVVLDLGSRNGTYLNGLRCQRGSLSDGAVLRAGATVLIYEDVRVPTFSRLEPKPTALQGPSLGLQRVRADIGLVAPETMPVLLHGESGVGKELVAAELHRLSGRTGPFIPVNCAAISPELAESELFGHVAGAFTGAAKKSDGLVAAAHGGTLFLDEIADLPADLQPKLLRALATREVRAVGASVPTHVDVRIVAAAHRDLDEAVAKGDFRGDLLARLKGWVIHIPALRQRRLDVLPLARLFMERFRAGTELTADAAEALAIYEWPYNVREVEQLIRAAVVRAQGDKVRRVHLPTALQGLLLDRKFEEISQAPVPIELRVRRDEVPSREELVEVITHFAGNMAEVATFFGKDRKQVYRWAEKFAIDVEALRR